MGDWLAVQTEFQRIKQLVKRWGVDDRPRENVDFSAVKGGHEVRRPFIFNDGLKFGLKPALKLRN